MSSERVFFFLSFAVSHETTAASETDGQLEGTVPTNHQGASTAHRKTDDNALVVSLDMYGVYIHVHACNLLHQPVYTYICLVSCTACLHFCMRICARSSRWRNYTRSNGFFLGEDTCLCSGNGLHTYAVLSLLSAVRYAIEGLHFP